MEYDQVFIWLWLNKHAQEVEIFLTSSSDLHSSHYLNGRGLDTAGEDRPGVIEARYNNLGNPAALIGHGAAGEKAIVKAPLYMNSLSSDQGAAVTDDTGGFDRWPQRHHWAGRLDLCTRLYFIL